MSSLNSLEKAKLEKLFEMSSGYVINFSDSTIGSFFGDFNIDIHGANYTTSGTSKAKKLREFWRLESDHLVGEVTLRMIDHVDTYKVVYDQVLVSQCRDIANRLLTGKVNLANLKLTAFTFDLNYMDRQIKRIEQSIEQDPDLAVGTSKELIETCCKTILGNLSIPFDERNDDLIKLVRLTMDQLELLPSNIDPTKAGSETLKRILGNLSSISQGITELRNRFGTGHGKDGQSYSLSPRHARLAVSASSALVHFMFETYLEKKNEK